MNSEHWNKIYWGANANNNNTTKEKKTKSGNYNKQKSSTKWKKWIKWIYNINEKCDQIYKMLKSVFFLSFSFYGCSFYSMHADALYKTRKRIGPK